jgi:hypothetical protein
MKLLRSLDLPPAKALAAAGALAHVALPIVHGTTLVALARPSQSPKRARICRESRAAAPRAAKIARPGILTWSLV